MATRTRDYTGDAERIAREVYTQYGDNISDRETFNEGYVDYMGVDGEPLLEKDNFSNHVFIEFNKFKKVSKGNIFKDAGGKNLKQDRRKDAKTIVTTPKEYIKKGAENVDLKGYDTRRQQYNKIGKYKGKIIKARETIFYRKGKKITRLRDVKGRFISRA